MTDMPERVKVFRRVGADVLHIGGENETMSWGNADGTTYVRDDIHRSLALDALAAETQAADAHAAQLKAEAMAAKLAEALRITREKLLITVHSEFDGVWSDADFSNETKEADAVLAEYEASK